MDTAREVEGRVGGRDRQWTLGSLSNDNGDGNENEKKKQNNNSARASRFSVHFLAVVTRIQLERA